MLRTYQIISRTIGARERCGEDNPWKGKWAVFLEELLEVFPHGSGFDKGTQLDDSSTPERLVFNTAFHHMNEAGSYDGWTEHQVIVKPSLEHGYRMTIGGRNRNEIKDYIGEMFALALDKEQEAWPMETAEIAKTTTV